MVPPMSFLGFQTGFGQNGTILTEGPTTGQPWPSCTTPGPLPWPFPPFPPLLPANGHAVFVGSAVSTTVLLTGNSSRKGAFIFNTSQYDLYALLSANQTPSSTLFTNDISGLTGWLVPSGYVGLVLGVWANTDAGGAMVTELT